MSNGLNDEVVSQNRDWRILLYLYLVLLSILAGVLQIPNSCILFWMCQAIGQACFLVGYRDMNHSVLVTLPNTITPYQILEIFFAKIALYILAEKIEIMLGISYGG